MASDITAVVTSVRPLSRVLLSHRQLVNSIVNIAIMQLCSTAVSFLGASSAVQLLPRVLNFLHLGLMLRARLSLTFFIIIDVELRDCRKPGFFTRFTKA